MKKVENVTVERKMKQRKKKKNTCARYLLKKPALLWHPYLKLKLRKKAPSKIPVRKHDDFVMISKSWWLFSTKKSWWYFIIASANQHDHIMISNHYVHESACLQNKMIVIHCGAYAIMIRQTNLIESVQFHFTVSELRRHFALNMSSKLFIF